MLNATTWNNSKEKVVRRNAKNGMSGQCSTFTVTVRHGHDVTSSRPRSPSREIIQNIKYIAVLVEPTLLC